MTTMTAEYADTVHNKTLSLVEVRRVRLVLIYVAVKGWA